MAIFTVTLRSKDGDGSVRTLRAALSFFEAPRGSDGGDTNVASCKNNPSLHMCR